MSFFSEIQNELVGTVDLSTILRKAKVLAYKLGNQEFKDWVENELNGYKDINLLPEYRKLETIAQGNFINAGWKISNQVIPLSLIPEKYITIFSELHLFQGIKELEAMLEVMNQNGENTLKISIPPEFYSLLDYKVYQYTQCTSAWRLLNKGQVTQVIETTRNSLLSFILELADKYPQIKSDSIPDGKIPNEEIRQVFNYIVLGDNSSINSLNR